MVELTVSRALRLTAERHPDRPAVTCGEASLTHGELNARGNRLANGLAAAGFGKGDRLGVVLPNGVDYVVVAYAVAKAGIVMVPLNYRLRGPELVYHLADADADGLIFGPSYRTAVDEAKANLPGLRTVAAGAAAPGDVASLAELELAPADEPAVSVSEEDLFYLGYTSGTTGRPKGAMITHRNRALAYHYWALEYGVDERDVALHAGPFHHTAPFGFTLMQLWMGGRVVILPAFDPRDALVTMARAGVTWTFMVPFMLNALLSLPAAELASHRPRALRFVISAASPLPTATKEGLLDTFPEVGVHEFYGATEAGVVTNLRPEEQRRKVRCVGKPILDTEVRVLTPAGEEAKPGEIGELHMKGPTLFAGYWNAPDMTAAAIRDDGWSTLGDLAYVDDEGYVYIVDRIKDVIKSGGVNIFPTEIEEALLSHPAVYEAAVVGAPDDRWGEAARAVVVLRPGAVAEAEEILRHCRGLLADYKVPKAVEFRDSLPRSPAGKILKRLLRDELWSGRRIKV